MLRFLTRSAAIALLFLALSPCASAQANAYVVRDEAGQRTLFGLDVSTGTTTRIGTVASPAAASEARLSASIHVLQWVGNGFSQLSSVRPLHNGAHGVYGICGLAVANVDGQAGEELLATTLEGDLLVYQLTGGVIGSLLYHRGFAGAIGTYSSIHVGDHLNNTTGAIGGDLKIEVYLAGSAGIIRLDQP
jgi:hypothetical protein